ncbi:MAG: methyltransferase [Sphingobacteriia bacterium]|nr:methyltransferase [Sphingobacteriia bacterium]
MPNNFFQFKQFMIQQEHCAMKVTTDACLFGAMVAEHVKQTISYRAQNIINSCLDIGTGTGLLSLMLAQKNKQLAIEAVEIDEEAAKQAEQNFVHSSWKSNLSVHCTSIQQFVKNNTRKFDFIISNPPFFNNDLKSNKHDRNIALHSAALSFEELIYCIKTTISAAGRFAILLPYHRTTEFIQLAKDYYLEEHILVKQTPNHPYFRSILFFNTQQADTKNKEIIIKLQDDRYSEIFIEYLKDYYLYL